MKLPKYCCHKASGRAYVKLKGKRNYLGELNSLESLARYNALCESLVNEGRAAVIDKLTIAQLKAAYLEHCETYYRKPDGTPTGETKNVRGALKYLAEWDDAPAGGFGTRKLMDTQELMIADGVVRTAINRHTCRIVAMFKWAVKHELIKAEVHQALTTVGGLPEGRTKAVEADPVLPVPEDDYEAALAEMTPTVAALCRLLYLTGMRVSEARLMQWEAIDRTVNPWRFEPGSHKTRHRGKRRVIFLGPQAQMILRPYIAERGYVFRSHDLMNRPYSLHGLECSVARACNAAKVTRWSPGRLRHNFATNVRAQYDLDAARCVLGHSEASTTTIYAERDFRRAAEIAAAVGQLCNANQNNKEPLTVIT